MIMKKALLFYKLFIPICLFAQTSLYEPDVVQVLELTFAEQNWDAVLDQYKVNSDNAEKQCDHTYEDERLLANCVLNGVVLDSVGVKFKGNSTYKKDRAKNPLNVKLNYVKDQAYDGYTTLKLSNVNMDNSYIREVLSYEILHSYMDAPKSNFMKVYINGSYYGLFTSSESIKPSFAKKYFGYQKPDAFVKGNAAEAMGMDQPSLKYISNDSADYKCSYQMKSEYGWGQLSEFINVLNNHAEDIENILDIDRAIWMLAYNNVTVNLDSYSGSFKQNYYLIWDKNSRFCPVIWDLNMNFGGFTMTGSGGWGWPGMGGQTDLSDMELFLHEDDDDWPLLQMVLNNKQYRRMYVAHCKTIMADYFENNRYKTLAQNWQKLVEENIDAQIDGLTYEQTVSDFGKVVELMDGRSAYFKTEPAYTASQPIINIVDVPDTVGAFSTVLISADILNASAAYVGYRHSGDEIFTKIAMEDKGNGRWEAEIAVDEKNTHYYIYAENDEAGMFSPQRAEYEYHKIYGKTKIKLSPSVVINEVVASNSTGDTDEAGEFDDWIELYNNTDSAISLHGYYLTDVLTEPAKWPLPDTLLPAGAYLIVWADKDQEQGPMHANFKVSALSETLALVNSEFEVVDSVLIANVPTDMAFARVPNGTGSFVVQEPTPLANNSPSVLLTQTIDLKKGWNLISFYVDPEDQRVEAVLGGIDFLQIKNQNGFYAKGGNYFLNSLFELTAGDGYLLLMNEDAVLSVTGEKSVVSEQALFEGWNLVGVPADVEIPCSDINSDAGIETIKDFDGSYSPGLPSSLGTLKPGKAYYLKAEADGNISF